MTQEQIQPVYLNKIFEDKNPSLYPWIPPFLINYLKKIIHQDYLNGFIASAKDKYGADFAQAYVEYAGLELELVGEENLPEASERVIFASNHPLGGLDGISLMHILGHRYPTCKFIVNDILMHMVNLRPLLLPINKHGGQARDAARKIQEAHASGDPVFTFPAGMVSRRKGGVIKDLEWGKSFISNAIKYQRDIVPIHVSGRNSNFFYGLANWRKRLGVKANLEMLYLVDESWKNCHSKITITFGKPIPYTSFTKEKSRDAWAADVKKKAYALVE